MHAGETVRSWEAVSAQGRAVPLVRFVADVTQIRPARTWVVDEAARAGAPDDVRRVVALLASEVVTNAVKHGPSGGLVEVAVQRTGDRLRVAVHDESSRHPVRLEPEPTAISGRGVMLVDRLAADWGVEPDGGAKTVWFEVPLQRGPTSPGPAGPGRRRGP